MQRIIIITITLISIVSTSCAQTRRVIRASLYPYLPNSAALYWDLEVSFEKENPSIDLQINLNPNYYDHRQEKGGILFESADVYELDSIFLEDFINSNKIQPLPVSMNPDQSVLLNPAKEAAFRKNVWWGWPHWVCGNFLFYKKNDVQMSEVKTLADLERIIGLNPEPKDALLIDLKGTSTLGEMYLDALFDQYKSASLISSYLVPTKIEENAVLAMQRVLALSPPGFGRDDDYHDRQGFYARQFARGVGRALVGYSERLYYVIMETAQSCRRNDGCIKGHDLAVKEWPLSDRGSQPISWVDMFVIDASAKGQKLADCETFIKYATTITTLRRILIPAWGDAPRYLLPARVELYSDQDVLKASPLHKDMMTIMQKAFPLSLPKLNENLRLIAKKLDTERLPENH